MKKLKWSWASLNGLLILKSIVKPTQIPHIVHVHKYICYGVKLKWCVVMLNQGDDLLNHTTFNLEC
jgi:hypothetical protein